MRKPRAVAPSVHEFRGLDIVVGLVATDLVIAAATQTAAPLVHVTDATPEFLRSFYGWEVSQDSDRAEARVLSLARLAVYSSDHMMGRAREEFGATRARLAAIPFGANCTLPEAMPEKPAPDPLRLLWVGSRWERKGGAIALWRPSTSCGPRAARSN
jgi:hypothetical protein